MTLKEFAQMLDGREYLHEITKEEEALAKQLGFVVVFGYSDDNAELRGAIDDEIGCFDGGKLEHEDLPDVIYAKWCDRESNYAWSYQTSIPHETFRIYEDGDYWCIGIVCDINKPKPTNADRIRAMSDEELAHFMVERNVNESTLQLFDKDYALTAVQIEALKHRLYCACIQWLKQPAEV